MTTEQTESEIVIETDTGDRLVFASRAEADAHALSNDTEGEPLPDDGD